MLFRNINKNKFSRVMTSPGPAFQEIFWLFFTLILCNFSVQTLQYFQKNFNLFFAHENIKKRASKVAYNQPQTLFSQVQPVCPNQPKIDFSYYKYVTGLICLLICVFFGKIYITFCDYCQFCIKLVIKMLKYRTRARL